MIAMVWQMRPAVEQTSDCGSGSWAAILVNVHRIDQTKDSCMPCRLKK